MEFFKNKSAEEWINIFLYQMQKKDINTFNYNNFIEYIERLQDYNICVKLEIQFFEFYFKEKY